VLGVVGVEEFFHRFQILKEVGCKGNLTNLRRELHSSLAKGNPK
jgi:hypothetical protein